MITYTNRRITYRENLNIIGEIILKDDESIIAEKIHIIDISYDGIQVVFSDNDFLFKYLENIENENSEIAVQFKYKNKEYFFKHTINWIRLHDLGEKSFYVLTSLNYKDKDFFKEDLLNLIYILQLQNLYFGKSVKKKEMKKNGLQSV